MRIFKEICVYLRDVLDVCNDEVALKYTNEMKYVMSKDEIFFFMDKRMKCLTLQNAKLIVNIQTIMDWNIDIIFKKDDINKLHSLIGHERILTKEENTTGYKINSRFLLKKNLLGKNDDLRKLFYIAAYASDIPSFHPYIKYLVDVILLEFYNQNKSLIYVSLQLKKKYFNSCK